MNKIASEVTVFVSPHFGKQRPFEVIGGKFAKSPQFPNCINKQGEGKTVTHLKSPLIERAHSKYIGLDEIYNNPRGLFVEGNSFRTGAYYGDVYEVPGKDKYYLFRITRDPHKCLILPRADNITAQMMILVESPEGRMSKVSIQRTGFVETDIETLTRRINSLKGCFASLANTITDEQIDTYVRAFYLSEKLKKIGAKK